MILHQFYLNCLAHASYLIGDEQTHTAAVVDPQRDIDQYLAFATSTACASRTSSSRTFTPTSSPGHLELRDRVGATIYLGAAAKAEYAFTPLADGDRSRSGASGCGARNAGTHAGVDLDPCFRSRPQRHRTVRRAHRRHAVCRRRRPARSARRARLVRRRSRRAALRLAARPSCCRCPTRASSIRRTAPARCAARRSARKPCRRSASSGA